MNTIKTIGYAAYSRGATLTPYVFERRALRDNDVAMEVLYSGVCHSDLHTVRDDWGWSYYPIVPGHEIIAKVIGIGSKVTKYKIGDHVGVGCLVDSCMECDQCHRDEEQMCRNQPTYSYSGFDRITNEPTQGGYSKHLVVREEFCLRIPETLDLSKAAPLLCAGITTYSPLRTWNVGPGSRVAVIGLGGLGHMAVKLAAALGAEVTVISRTAAKVADALDLGADKVLISSNEKEMLNAENSFDLIIDTIPAKHGLDPYLPLLDIDGTLVIVGQVGPMDEISTFPLLLGRRRIASSPIGGIRETQEMLDFCAKKGIVPECEMIRMDQINEAFERMEQADVRYRFVIDMASLAHE